MRFDELFNNSNEASIGSFKPLIDDTLRAHDHYYDLESNYNVQRAIYEDEIRLKLSDLKSRLDTARIEFESRRDALLELMRSHNIKEVACDDRDNIRLEIQPGKRKQITKSWLIERFGEEEGQTIWDSGPKSDDKVTIKIEPKYNTDSIF